MTSSNLRTAVVAALIALVLDRLLTLIELALHVRALGQAAADTAERWANGGR